MTSRRLEGSIMSHRLRPVMEESINEGIPLFGIVRRASMFRVKWRRELEPLSGAEVQRNGERLGACCG